MNKSKPLASHPRSKNHVLSVVHSLTHILKAPDASLIEIAGRRGREGSISRGKAKERDIADELQVEAHLGLRNIAKSKKPKGNLKFMCNLVRRKNEL